MRYAENVPALLVLFIFTFFFQINTVTASGTITKCINQPVTLNWSSSNVTASGCTLVPSNNNSLCNFTATPDTSGSKTITLPSGSCTATLTCGTVSDTTTLNIDTTATWNGTSCVPNEGGCVANLGAACSSSPNSCGQTGSGTIQCNGSCSATTPSDAGCPSTSLPNASIWFNPTTIASGDYTTVGWSSSNATLCEFSTDGGNTVVGSTANPFGFWNFNNTGSAAGPYTSNQTWTINCSNSSGSKYASATLVIGKRPNGFLDMVSSGASCGYVSGWTFDPDLTTAALDVHLYMDGPAGSGIGYNIGATTAVRSDVNATFGITGTHGFGYQITPTPAPGTHTMYAYGIGVNGAGVQDGLNSPPGGMSGSSSPVTFTCDAPPPLTVSCSVSPITGTTATTYSWSSTAGGGNGTYSYSWSGTDSLSGSTANVSKTYATAGTKTGSVTITSGGVSATAVCTSSVTVTAPDLTAGGVSPTTAVAGVPVTLSGTVSNIGNATTGSSFPNYIIVRTGPDGTSNNDIYAPNMTAGPLAPGANQTISAPPYTFASAGTYSAILCADIGPGWVSTLDESGGDNNCGPWTNIIVSSGSCANGANNYPTCNTCTAPLVWNTSTLSCVSALSISVNPTTYSVTLPSSTITATYTLTNGTSANTTCRLLDNVGNPLTTYASCSGSMSVTAPAVAGTYGYSIQAYKSQTAETKTSNSFTVTVSPVPTCAGTTISNCSLANTPSGGTSGSCTSGYSGTCTYGCTSGTWSVISNTCVLTPTAILSASPTIIDQGQSSALFWSSTNATSCTAVGGFNTGGATTNPQGGVSTGALSSTQNYQIRCDGAGGQTYSNIATVTVLQPVINSFTATPARVQSGSSSLISWSASNVSSCTVSGPSGFSATGLSGSKSATNITSQSTYTIICQTQGSPISESVTVNILPLFQEF